MRDSPICSPGWDLFLLQVRGCSSRMGITDHVPLCANRIKERFGLSAEMPGYRDTLEL